MKILFFSLLFSILFSGYSYAQQRLDTFQFPDKPPYNVAFKGRNWYTSDFFLLSHKIIPYAPLFNFPGLIIVSDSGFNRPLVNRALTITSEASITHCVIIKDDGRAEKFLYQLPADSLSNLVFSVAEINEFIEFKKGLSLNKCSSNDPILFSNVRSQSGQLFFNENEINSIQFEHISFPEVFFSKNKIRKIEFRHSAVDALSIVSDTMGQADKAAIKVPNKYVNDEYKIADDTIPDFYYLLGEDAHFKKINIANIKANIVKIDLFNSSIEKEFSFTDINFAAIDKVDKIFTLVNTPRLKEEKIKNRQSLCINLEKCTINAVINNFREERNLSYSFKNCIFNESADISELNFDTLIINNCTKILSTLYLKIPENNDAYFSILNSDLSKISFEYTKNLHFLPDPFGTASADEINNTYVSLLNKFRLEGRVNSYEKMDIEFRQWKYNKKGMIGRITNSIDHYWWHYGYRKHYILYWSLLFLFIFYMLNFICWSKLQNVYPVIQRADFNLNKKISATKRFLLKAFHVLVFTVLIFFSFRVDFKKINFNNTGMLLFFFLQYIIGLTCLFFIVNFILKT